MCLSALSLDTVVSGCTFSGDGVNHPWPSTTPSSVSLFLSPALSFCLSVQLSSALLISMPYSINRNVLSGHLPVLFGGCDGSDYGIRVGIRRDGFCVCSSPFSDHVHTDVLLWVTYWGSSLELWIYWRWYSWWLRGIVCVCVFCGHSGYSSGGLHSGADQRSHKGFTEDYWHNLGKTTTHSRVLVLRGLDPLPERELMWLRGIFTAWCARIYKFESHSSDYF